jgi:hypothetical protein
MLIAIIILSLIRPYNNALVNYQTKTIIENTINKSLCY